MTKRSASYAATLALGAVLAWGMTAGAAPQAQNPQPKTVKDVVCGMNVDPATTKYKTTYEGETYYFCSDTCLQKFTKEPAKYVKKEPAVKDPVCGMTVDPAKTTYKTTYEGTTYYFCSDTCLQKFTKEPAKYVKK